MDNKTFDIAEAAMTGNNPLDMFLKGIDPENKEKQAEADFLASVKKQAETVKTDQVIAVGDVIAELFTPRTNVGVFYLDTFVGNKIDESTPISKVDLYVAGKESITLNSAERRVATIPNGIVLKLPAGIEGVIRPLSDWASKGIVAVSTAIDSHYRGEISCVVINYSTRAVKFDPGTRIAQLVFSPTVQNWAKEESSAG